jgi:hypothetical protein
MVEEEKDHKLVDFVYVDDEERREEGERRQPEKALSSAEERKEQNLSSNQCHFRLHIKTGRWSIGKQRTTRVWIRETLYSGSSFHHDHLS